MPLTVYGRCVLVAVLLATVFLNACLAEAPADPSTGDVDGTGAPEIIGLANVIDGDSLEVDGISIRLSGVDTFESAQYCYRKNGTRWRCGHWGSVELDRLAGGEQVVCTPIDKDSYGRVVARCLKGGTDLARALVAGGWGLAYRKYSKDYTGEEDEARSRGRGVWSSDFEAPWEWRARIRSGK